MGGNNRRISKSLFALFSCGILAFAALIYLLRMPRASASSASISGSAPSDPLPLTAAAPIGGKSKRQGSAPCSTNSNCMKNEKKTPSSTALDNFLSSINQRHSPCNDFYEYACGAWIKAHPIPPSMSKWSPFAQRDMEGNRLLQEILEEREKPGESRPLRMAKQFYASCINTVELDKLGLAPVRALLREYGGWPILHERGSWEPSSFDWMRSVADLKRKFGTSALLDVFVNQSPQTPALSTIHLQQPSLFLSRPYYIYKSSFTPYLNAFVDLIVGVASELGSGSERGSGNISYLREKAIEIVAFEEEIARISRDGVELQYGLKNYTATLTLLDLQHIFDNYTTPKATNKIDLRRLLNLTFISTGLTIYNGQRVSMSDSTYVGALFELLSSTKVETLANYLHFRMLGWLLSGTTGRMREIIHNYQSVIYGVTSPVPRPTICSSSTEEKFGLALAPKYLEKRRMGGGGGDEGLIRAAGKMLEQIRSSFITLIDSSKNMSAGVRAGLKKKSREISSCIGHAPWMGSGSGSGSGGRSNEFDKVTYERQLETHFNGLELGSGSYLQKLFNVRIWQTDQKLKTLNEKFIPGCKWNTFPGQIGAFYDIKRGAVNIPLGILQPPFFNPELPLEVSYGALGSILGHEFAHGLTLPGLTETGGSGDFSPLSTCLIQQYSRYRVIDDLDLYINGALTLDENFPDNGGLAAAYKAMQSSAPNSSTSNNLSQYTKEQLFFLGFANIWCSSTRRKGLVDQVLQDHHTPNKYRVLGVLQNSKEFSAAFNCPPGSPMNPQNYKKCDVF